MSSLALDVAALLRAHDIDGPETPLSHNGYSGARITAIESAGGRYIVKRMRFADDWIMQATHDDACREAQFAASSIPKWLPDRVREPSLGASRDGDGWALVMRDIAPSLLPDEGDVSAETVDELLRAIARMHATFWDNGLDGADVGWCTLRDRLAMLSPEIGRQLIDSGRDFGLARGWEAFGTRSPLPAVELVRRLQADPSPFLRLLDTLPATLLHGDLKFANIGVDDSGVWLLDWALVARGPVAVEMAWFLAVNSGRLPWPLDETLDRYANHLERELGPEAWPKARWDVQRAAAFLSGLLMYGWGKALDAEAGRPDELRWWCEGALEAARLL